MLGFSLQIRTIKIRKYSTELNSYQKRKGCLFILISYLLIHNPLVNFFTMMTGRQLQNQNIREIMGYSGHRDIEKGFPCCRISDDATKCCDDVH